LILITEHLEPQSLHWLEQRATCHYDPELAQNPKLIQAFLGNASGLIVRNKTKVSEELLQHAPKLQVVGRLGVGLDNLELAALATRSITAVYAPGANANAVAELSVLFMLAHLRKLLLADRSARQGIWARESIAGRELQGKVVGIVGLGAVGRRLAELCQALGCRVNVHTRSNHHGFPALTLEELLASSDFISLNVPLTPQTEKLIGARELALLQPHAYILNTARGAVVDEAALYQVLKEGRIGGAALDVRSQEPPGKEDPFAALDNVILTPHLGGWTLEAQDAVCQMVVEDVWRVLEGLAPRCPVPGLNFVSAESERLISN
jgi:(S)-sulfolactate dehydrogenase